MTTEQEKNLRFVQQSVSYAGFGDMYRPAIEEGIKAGLPELPLDPTYKSYGKDAAVKWDLKITEHPDRPAFYNFNGIQATLVQEGTDPITQFFKHFRGAGPTVDQTAAMLMGGTALITEYSQDTKRFVFAKLDLTQDVKPGEDYPIIKHIVGTDKKNVKLSELTSKEDIYMSQSDKEKLFESLQAGFQVPVRVRQKVDGKETLVPVTLQLDLTSERNLALNVTNSDGVLIRQHEKETKKAIGMHAGEGLSDNIKEMFKSLDTPRIGGPSMHRA